MLPVRGSMLPIPGASLNQTFPSRPTVRDGPPNPLPDGEWGYEDLAHAAAPRHSHRANVEFLAKPHPAGGRNKARVGQDVVAAGAAGEVRRQHVRAQIVRGDVEDATADDVGDPQPPVGTAGQRAGQHERKRHQRRSADHRHSQQTGRRGVRSPDRPVGSDRDVLRDRLTLRDRERPPVRRTPTVLPHGVMVRGREQHERGRHREETRDAVHRAPSVDWGTTYTVPSSDTSHWLPSAPTAEP